MKVNPHRSSLGMDANIMALLCYIAAFVIAWIPFIQYIAFAAPLVIFFLEKDSPFVKFHAIQSLIMSIIACIFTIIAYSISFAAYFFFGFFILITVLLVIGFIAVAVFSIYAMIKAYGYEEYKIPLIGNLAEKFSKGGTAL
ncbi:DUF4870 domain-containing protein [Oscillospiraceae bacterium WX1]